MNYSHNTFASVIVVAALAITSTTAAFAAEILVVDPISGDTIPVTEVAFRTLTEAQRQDVGDQLAEQGYRVRPDGPAQEEFNIRADVNVIDPTSGEMAALRDIDISSLSEEERRDIGDQLAEQGINLGHGPAKRRELPDVEVIDPTSGETVSLADLDVSGFSADARRSIGDQLAEQSVNPGRGGEGHGNRPRN